VTGINGDPERGFGVGLAKSLPMWTRPFANSEVLPRKSWSI